MADADVFACQVKACKTFFEDELPSGFEPLPEKDWPSSMPQDWTGKVYDITGFYGQKVVALLSLIVNDKDQFTKGKTFYLLIRRSPKDEVEELFRLKADPSPDQPGNAVVFLRPRRRKRFKRGSAKSYEELNGDLKAFYEKPDDEGRKFSDTTSFARDMKQLFKNNAAQIDDLPQPTFEAYMILLFEIARRLVKIEKPSESKEEFDVLPIGSAIARLIKLLELRNQCSFEEVFLQGSRFHCFTGKPDVRRKAIEEINEETRKTKHPTTTRVTVRLSKEDVEEIETKRQIQELRELFCPSSEEELANTFKNLTTRIAQEKSSQSSRMLSTSNAERTTAFDHLE